MPHVCYYQQKKIPLTVSMKNKTSVFINRSFQGRVPILETSDVDLMKQLVIKEFNLFHNRHNVFQGEQHPLLKYALSITEDGHWKHVRDLVTPTFSIMRVKAVRQRLWHSHISSELYALLLLWPSLCILNSLVHLFQANT